MATRRGRNAPVEPPPPPPSPPIPPEEKTVEPEEEQVEKLSEKERKRKSSADSDLLKRPNCPEKIIERIIICPGGQNNLQSWSQGHRGPNHFHPPPPPTLVSLGCCPKKKHKKCKKKPKHDHCKKDKDMSHISAINGCKNKMYPRQPQVSPCFPAPGSAPVVVYQPPQVCCCCKHESDDDVEEDDDLIDTTTFISFANMVFAAANVMSDTPDAYC